jgi:arylsulfatase A
MKIVTWVLLATALLFTACTKEKVKDSPNIVFILADDMGYGDISSYGATKIQTPNIDRLAKEGILFTDGHCGASTCTPTRYGLLTGRNNWRTWLKYSALSTSAPMLIEEGRMTLASMLQEEGYTTSIVGKWHLGFGREEGFEENRGDTPPNYWETRGSGPDWNGELKPGPMECGFDYSYVIPIANSFPPYVIVEGHYIAGLQKANPITNMVSKNNGLMEGGDEARWKDEELVDILTNKVVSQLEDFAKEDQPFFLYYSPHQPHIPHRPNERFKGSSQVGNYGDVIQELDWSVGEILNTLDNLGLTENTLVIFSSDNGAGHYGDPRMGHYPCGPLRGGKGDVTEGGHRIPLLARWPGKIEPNTRSQELVSLTDMMATFAAVIDKELPPNTGEDSYNVLPALLGKKLPDPDRPVVFSSGGTGALSIRVGKWKFIDGQGDCGYKEFGSGKPHPEPKPGDPPGQLYNLDEDMGETNNLYNKHPELVKMMKQKLEEIKNAER